MCCFSLFIVIYGYFALLDKITHSLTLCVKIVLRKYLSEVQLFCAKSAKKVERP
jgi:hypothetical protein